MSRLIDADEYKRLIDEQLRFYQPKESSPFHNKILELQREILDSMPTIPAIPVAWIRDKIDGYASRLKSRELDALVTVLTMWQKEQEGI